jgi:hypothetical protein
MGLDRVIPRSELVVGRLRDDDHVLAADLGRIEAH